MEILFSSILGENLTLTSTIVLLVISAALGFIISLSYLLTHRRTGYSQSLAGALIILPAIFTSVLLFVGSNLASGLAIAGLFTLIRFRSAPGDVKDLTYLVSSLAIGVACGNGCIGYAVVITLILTVIIVLVEVTGYASQKSNNMVLRITMPESISFESTFDSILDQYTNWSKLKRVRTTDYGALFEVIYNVSLKKGASKKAMIDAIRLKNGNLPVSLSEMVEEEVKSF